MSAPVVVDANVFLRAIVRAQTPQDVSNAAEAESLFIRCEQGILELTTNAAVVAEVVFILSSKRHYALNREETVARLVPLIRLPGCHLFDKEVLLRALERWQQNPRVSFVDAVVIEQAFAGESEVSTFDHEVRRTPGLKVWRPE
ncbi:MAG: type II toxin-antitoxin system VapC family toxin [Thermomicrobiales bacterium]